MKRMKKFFVLLSVLFADFSYKGANDANKWLSQMLRKLVLMRIWIACGNTDFDSANNSKNREKII